MSTLPAIFVSHGAPTLVLEDIPATRFLADLGRSLPRPKAILCVSAHWETAIPTISEASEMETIHDFYGFPDELFQIRYPASGAPVLASRAAELLEGRGFQVGLDPRRGLDHGAWVPLKLMYPLADVPVTQLSVLTSLETDKHFDMGKALKPLRDEGVLILASGGAVHNLRKIDWSGGDAEPWAKEFDAWTRQVIESGDVEAGKDFLNKGPMALQAHPRTEHFMPLFVAWGAAGGNAGTCVHESWSHGNLSLAAYRFE